MQRPWGRNLPEVVPLGSYWLEQNQERGQQDKRKPEAIRGRTENSGAVGPLRQLCFWFWERSLWRTLNRAELWLHFRFQRITLAVWLKRGYKGSRVEARLLPFMADCTVGSHYSVMTVHNAAAHTELVNPESLLLGEILGLVPVSLW